MPSTHSQTNHRSIELDPTQHAQLLSLASSSRDASIQLRAQIILSWASGATGEQSAKLLDTSRRTVSKWRSRFRQGGVEALSDRPRPGAPRTISSGKIAEVLQLRQTPPPQGKPRWTTRMLAQHTGLSQSTVVRISRSHEKRASHAPPSHNAHANHASA